MLCRRVSLEELHPALDGGAPETGLDIYCRGRTGLLADDGARWAVLILPGGGYERIAPAEGEPVALAFLAAGVQAFVLSYSVLPALWPRQFLEGAAALAWMRANAPELGFRPDRVAVCGFSAGGHLAGCLAGGYAEPLLNERLGLTPEQVRPDAAILGYPVAIWTPWAGRRCCGRTAGWARATRPPFSGPRWGTPRCRWKIPWTMPAPCGRGRCLLSCTCFRTGPMPWGWPTGRVPGTRPTITPMQRPGIRCA